MSEKNITPDTDVSTLTVKAFEELTQRTILGSILGSQYKGERDIYDALGYPKTISFEKYKKQYLRQDIAGAIINRPVERTWMGDVDIINDNSDELQKKWQTLSDELGLKQKFIRADKLSSIGRYGVLLLGFSDITKQSEWSTPVQKNVKIEYVAPYDEDSARIIEFETDPRNKRFGLPKIYKIQVSNQSTDGTTVSTITLRAHYSRIIHITGETLESEIYGLPTLQRVWNRLMDLEKMVGGSAEMYWRGAYPERIFKSKDGYSLPANLSATLDAQFKQIEHGLRRTMAVEGVDLEQLRAQVSDPSNAVDVQISMISAETGIPKRILIGSERGELSSSQDSDSFAELIHTRREEYAEIQILFPFVDKMMELGILPKQEYSAVWSSLINENEKQRAEIAKIITEAVAKYSDSIGVQEILPPELYFKHVLKLPDEMIEQAKQYFEEINRDVNQDDEPESDV